MTEVEMTYLPFWSKPRHASQDVLTSREHNSRFEPLLDGDFSSLNSLELLVLVLEVHSLMIRAVIRTNELFPPYKKSHRQCSPQAKTRVVNRRPYWGL